MSGDGCAGERCGLENTKGLPSMSDVILSLNIDDADLYGGNERATHRRKEPDSYHALVGELQSCQVNAALAAVSSSSSLLLSKRRRKSTDHRRNQNANRGTILGTHVGARVTATVPRASRYKRFHPELKPSLYLCLEAQAVVSLGSVSAGTNGRSRSERASLLLPLVLRPASTFHTCLVHGRCFGLRAMRLKEAAGMATLLAFVLPLVGLI